MHFSQRTLPGNRCAPFVLVERLIAICNRIFRRLVHFAVDDALKLVATHFGALHASLHTPTPPRTNTGPTVTSFFARSALFRYHHARRTDLEFTKLQAEYGRIGWVQNNARGGCLGAAQLVIMALSAIVAVGIFPTGAATDGKGVGPAHIVLIVGLAFPFLQLVVVPRKGVRHDFGAARRMRIVLAIHFAI